MASLAAQAFLIDTSPRTVVEYFNDRTGHYFLVADFHEQDAIDHGSAGPGWRPTGHVFSAWGHANPPLRPPLFPLMPVCRFYAAGPNTHFFTLSAAECDLLRTNAFGWTFEQYAFDAGVPVDGSCPGGGEVRRFYNGRFGFNDSNHRYVADATTQAEMSARGWIDEGIAFCVASANVLSTSSYTVDRPNDPAETFIRPVEECLAARGSCVGLNGIAGPMANRVAQWVPVYPSDEPRFSDLFMRLTNSTAELFTAQPIVSASEIAAHSFVQACCAQFGLRVTSADRIAGAAVGAIEPLYRFDETIRPYAAGRHEAAMGISFNLRVKTMERADAQSHAWGAAMIELRDTRSGDAIAITLQAFGTIPPGDFVGAVEAGNPTVFVSTVFRADPAFGSSRRASFLPCPTAACEAGVFMFDMTRVDFAKALTLARTSNPRLSAAPEDYVLVDFRFRSGVYGEASSGIVLQSLRLDLFGY